MTEFTNYPPPKPNGIPVPINLQLGFGYGKKTDLDVGKHPHQITPSPDKYQTDTFVETNGRHKNGYTCAIGRDVQLWERSLRRQEVTFNWNQ